MHEKFQCYCTTNVKTLEDSIAALEQKIPQIEASIKETEAAGGGVAAQREKEAAEFAKVSGDLKANIAACGKAIDAISKGMGASFLQSTFATSLRQLVLTSTSLARYDRQTLTEFLSTSNQQGYAPASGEIVGILKQLLENMEGDLKDAQESLADDQKFLAELKKSCATAGDEYDERKAMRAQEVVAIAETIKILNDDDALDLFKKTLPSPSLIQLTRTDRDARDEALAAIQDLQDSKHPQAGLIQLALLGKKVGFEKIVKMIDDMVVLLGEEQKDDDAQKAWCEKEFDQSEDKQKDLKRAIDLLETKISETTDAIATLKDEIAALVQGIKDLDKAVAEAMETRKEEHAEFTQTAAENNAALQLLEVAKNRLNKFYNPKLYKPPPKRELTEEERLYAASGGVLTTPAPGGIAGTGIAVFS